MTAPACTIAEAHAFMATCTDPRIFFGMRYGYPEFWFLRHGYPVKFATPAAIVDALSRLDQADERSPP